MTRPAPDARVDVDPSRWQRTRDKMNGFRGMSHTRRTIAVVDDDAGMGKAIERLLNVAGYGTTSFRSAEALLDDDVAVRAADCFILDIQLPGLSGFELHGQIAMRRAIAPVIFITAHDDPATREQAQALGAAAFFAKPFRRQPLLVAIAGALVMQ